MIRAELQSHSFAYFAKTGGMTPDQIRMRLEKTGRTEAALGRFLGKKKDSMSRLLNSNRSMTVDEAKLIEEFFAEETIEGPKFRTVDVYGYRAPGGPDRIEISDTRVLDHIELPDGLVRGEMIAIRVAGDSMEPRLFAGEIVIASLGVPPMRNADCIVEFKDGTAVVKIYRGQKDGFVFLGQFNPEEEIRIQASNVKNIHAIAYRR